MKTKKNHNLKKNNKTKKERQILTDKLNVINKEELTLEDIILYTKNNSINEKVNTHLLKQFQKPFTKEQLYLKNNNFFDYVTKEWEGSLPKENISYMVKVDDFRIVQYKVYNELDEIVINFINSKNDIVSTEIKNLYNSVLKMNSIKNSKIKMKQIINQIDEYRKDKKNLWKMLAMVNKNEMINLKGPISWEVGPDLKDINKYVDYINPHAFAAQMPEIFSSNVPKELLYYKKEFVKYLKIIIDLTCPDIKLNDVMKVQNIFYDMFDKIDPAIKENEENYYKIESDEALEKYGFNWKEYCLELGYKENEIPSYFITTNLNYLKFCIEWLLENWDSEMMRSFWIAIYSNLIVKITDKWTNEYFNFYGNKLTGMAKAFTKSKSHVAINVLIIGFNALLNNEYIDKHYDEATIVYAKNMSEDFRNIFINKLQRNKWLEPKTRLYAIEKLKNIDINIGNNKINFNNNDLPLLNFNENQFLENMFKIMEWRKNIFLSKNKKRIEMLLKFDYLQYPMKFLGMTSYIVNAQYTPNNNSIIVTNAYLQKPFVNLTEHGISYNLAHLGFTIGHELSHSLDDSGSMFDIEGNLNNWWSSKDKRKYKKIQDEIINQYNKFGKYYGINFDAEMSIGEDIADINGLTLCEEYLRNFCLKNKYSSLITFQFFREFYIYFAYQMKQKINKKAIMYDNFINPHPIDKLRTNVPLSRSLYFRNIYNIKPNEKMYWHNKHNIWD